MNKIISKKIKNEKGQARPQLRSSGGQVVLIVLLASALVLTMGLSVSKKTVTETKIDTDEELLKQAFNTAESGIDYYLKTGLKTYTSSDNKSSATVTMTNIGGGSTLASEGVVTDGNPYLFWLVNHNSDGSIGNSRLTGTINRICVDSEFTGGLKVDLFNLVGGNYGVSRTGYNIRNEKVEGFGNLINGNCTGSISISSGLLLSITPIGDSTKITVESNMVFPSQGEEITSVGSVSDGVNTKINVLNKYEVPVFMLEAITSGDNVD